MFPFSTRKDEFRIEKSNVVFTSAATLVRYSRFVILRRIDFVTRRISSALGFVHVGQ